MQQMKFFNTFLKVIVLVVSSSANAAPVTVDFLVDIDRRSTSVNDQWVVDSNYTGQEFTLSVTFDSNGYNLGERDYWDGQGVTSYRPSIYPISASETPFDTEINSVQPTLDYHGDTETTFSGSVSGEYSYNQTFQRSTISQDFYLSSGVSYYDSPSRYIASFERSISLGFRTFDETMTLGDIVPLSLEEYLDLGLGQTFSFRQQVDEDSNENWTYPGGAEWITVDGGIRYSGNAIMTNVAVVPVPAAVWLFGSGLLGLVGVARRKKA